MSEINLSFATRDYDHVRDLITGRVTPQGITLNSMIFADVVHMFHRATNYGDFDITELSFGRYASMISQGRDEYVGIPVFPSRASRISAYYVRRGGPIKKPEDLAGARIGVPEWAQTATVYGRGWLAEHVGVDLNSVKWFQAGVDEPGRPEAVELKLPAGIDLTRVTDASLSEMLLAGDIDCALTAAPPTPFRDGDKRIQRLIKDPSKAERAYYKATGIFPIMHLMAIRHDIHAAYPWAAANLFTAFLEAKDNALARAGNGRSPGLYPIPWSHDAVRDMVELFGADYRPYGLEPNRPTLEAFLRFGADQGAFHKQLTPEELFAPQTVDLSRV